MKCKCGRPAVALGDHTGEPKCWELVCDSQIAWKDKYEKKPEHKEARHETINL